MTRAKRRKRLPALADADVRFGTPPDVAAYRAQRLACDTLIEVGCGAGFATHAFAATCGRVYAIDRDAAAVARARILCAAHTNITFLVGDALSDAFISQLRGAGTTRLFCDPSRPSASARRTLDELSPDPRALAARYASLTTELAIEMPPFLAEMPFEGEREYLSLRHTLNRLTLYSAPLARAQRSVVLLPGGQRLESSAPEWLPAAPVAPSHVLVPDPALAAAQLIGAAARGLRCRAVRCGKRLVLLAAFPRPSPFFAAYRLLEKSSASSLARLLLRTPAKVHGLPAAPARRGRVERDIFATSEGLLVTMRETI